MQLHKIDSIGAKPTQAVFDVTLQRSRQPFVREVSKKQAEKAFAKAVPALIALPSLMEKTRTFAASWKDKPRDELKYCPHPATWLNDARYNDEPDYLRLVVNDQDARHFAGIVDAAARRFSRRSRQVGWGRPSAAPADRVRSAWSRSDGRD